MLMNAAALLPLLVPATATAQQPAFDVILGLPLRNLDALEALFWRVADPLDEEEYLNHRSVEELAAIVAPLEADMDAAEAWLRSLGAVGAERSTLHGSVTATFPAGHAAVGQHWSGRGIPLKASCPVASDFIYRRDALASTTEPSAEESLASPEPLLMPSRYTIKEQKAAIGMPDDLQASHPDTLQMVWGPGTFGYSKLQLAGWKKQQCPLLNLEKVKADGFAGKPGDNYGEGNLDARMISSFGLNVSTLVSNTNTSMACEEGEGFGLAMLDFVNSLAERKTLPQVLSLSLGSLSPYSCKLLCTEAVKKGQDLAKCQEFMQEQRQVCMFIDDAQVARINTGLQMLGLRGVSVFGSSGDGGSHWSFQEFPANTEMGKTLNEVGCEFMFPIFPSPSPYMISVGGSEWQNGDPSKPIAWSGSGSGFAWQFEAPAHQKEVVAKYLSSTKGLPMDASFNAKGRGYPDISAVAVEGTSESSPSVAGIFSMVMDHRLQAGLRPLGFLAPRLWATAAAKPGVAVDDITIGNSNTSCRDGFPATVGWDPVTGWGRPAWKGLLATMGSDADLHTLATPAN